MSRKKSHQSLHGRLKWLNLIAILRTFIEENMILTTSLGITSWLEWCSISMNLRAWDKSELWLAAVWSIESIATVEMSSEPGQLRWFFRVGIQRAEVGKRLMDTVLEFCKETEHARVSLWTLSGLVVCNVSP